jgi:hypothetical protein
MKPTCETCCYFQPPEHGGKGQCRRYSPILWGSVAYWPAVTADEWCGDHSATDALRQAGKGHLIARRNQGGKPADPE